MVSMQANPAQWVMPNLPGGGDGHYHPANAASRPLTVPRLPPSGEENPADHGFCKRLTRQELMITR